ncbi:hypothetical protein A7U60_g5007 [Sanghuangporus baumii]|uniref:Uncharacterized protein n=1 Tax=Sanghuangporus baumii TaxID=108892 RepID=A0A9Q5N4A2_SANBA|nr:hypothetical protein A7U60_g5007 [Sanghuangporus baumii]
MSTPDFPPLPLIIGDLILETFSHKSLNLGYDPDISTDNQRLAELGRTMLEFAVTRYLYSKRPIVAGAEIPFILSSSDFKPQETRHLFQAYVGAVVAQSGPTIAANWITQLIDPQAEILSTLDDQETVEHRAAKRLRTQPPSPASTPPPLPSDPPSAATAARPSNERNLSNHSAAQIIASAPSVMPTIGPQIVPNKTSSAQKGAGYLLVFNQRCSQQHLQVEYQAVNHGSPHAPVWLIKCLVNGIQKGEGQGSSKQAAKEAAAKQAYYSMGWTAYHGMPS